jgi:hypothetical protein
MKDENPHRAGQGATGAEDQAQQRQSTSSSAPPQLSGTARQSADETAIEFLRLMLPDRGFYAAMIVKSAKQKYNRFASTIPELWEIIKKADKAGDAAYHACASFKEARHDPKGTPRARRRYGRTKHNADWAKALWADIDAGVGKPYADWHEAANAVGEFCKKTGLPRPLVVLSGLGLHVYWPLQEALDREIWERYARGLKALAAKHGLHVDPARTADISSVLRTPGTHHRKGEIRRVRCGPFVQPFQIEQFSILLEVAEELPTADREIAIFNSAELPPWLRDGLGEPLKDRALAGMEEFEPSSGEMVAARCQQLRKLRDEKGRLTEPLWYAGLGVLASCGDGDRLGHDWSSGDPRYTEQETQERLDRARGFGPTTCAKFHSLNPEPCVRCPHWQKITSPIQLGRDTERDNRAAPNEGGEESEKSNNREEESNQTNSEEQHDQAQENSGASQNPFPLRWHGESDPNISRKWLVKERLPETGAGLISGQWGTYKTFIAIDLSASVMTGKTFSGRPVKRKGGVLFIAAEGASEIPIRLCGVVEAKFPEHKGNLPFAWSEQSPMLLAKDAPTVLKDIAERAADRMRAEFNLPLVLIVIDTMSAAAGFRDENSSAEGQLAMNVLGELSKCTGALVLACDHFGKAVETGTRGTSAKEAAADVVVACLAEKNSAGNVTNRRIAIRKLRSGLTGGETNFTLRTVNLGLDEDGEPITTCVVEWSPVTVTAAPEVPKGKGWPKPASLFRASLVTATEQHGSEQKPFPDGPAVLAVELEKVHQEFDKRYALDGPDRDKALSKRRQAFKRSRTEAEARGLIGGREIDGKFMVWLTNPEDGATQPKSSPPGQR